jgi:hypothetical protein
MSNLCARLGRRRLRRLRQWFLRRRRRVHRWLLRRRRRVHRWLLRRLRRLYRRCGWRLRRGHRWCLRSPGGVAPWCPRGPRPGCGHGRPATAVVQLSPGARRNAGDGVIVAGCSLLGPPAAIPLRRCAHHRSGPLNRGELGHRLRGIGARAEREPGQLPRGAAAGGAGEQLDQDRHRANQDRRYPCDPHGHQAGQPGFGRALHDDRSVVAIPDSGAGGSLPRGGADGYPSRVGVPSARSAWAAASCNWNDWIKPRNQVAKGR